MSIETMRVKCAVTADNEHGFYVINKEDFDAEKHEDFDVVEAEPAKPAETVAAAEPSWKK